MEKITVLLKIIIGNLLLAAAVNAFIVPFSIIAGGTTGLAMILAHFVNLSIPDLISILTIGCFFIGLLFLGRSFALTTLISSIIYPIFIKATVFLNHITVTNDPLMAALISGLMMGTALGLVLQSGASTGGMDIPPLMAEKYFKIPVSIAMYVQDSLILAAQIPFSDPAQILSGLIFTAVAMFWMNRILTTGKSAVQILVISQAYRQIQQALLSQENKGVSLLEMETGYTGQDGKAILSVFSRSALNRIRTTIYKIDPQAFMIVSNVQEVRGTGFKSWQSNLLFTNQN